jgi:hypothetical protein
MDSKSTTAVGKQLHKIVSSAPETVIKGARGTSRDPTEVKSESLVPESLTSDDSCVMKSD